MTLEVELGTRKVIGICRVPSDFPDLGFDLPENTVPSGCREQKLLGHRFRVKIIKKIKLLIRYISPPEYKTT